MTVKKFLMDRGVKLSSKGFDYIVYAIELCQHDDMYLKKITTLLYPTIAKHFKDEPNRVERAIRHAKPYGFTNGEFIRYCLIELED